MIPLAHKVKTTTTNHKLPPRPKPNEISRGNNRNTDTKRHRQEEHHYSPMTMRLLPQSISNPKKTNDLEFIPTKTYGDTSHTIFTHIHEHVNQTQFSQKTTTFWTNNGYTPQYWKQSFLAKPRALFGNEFQELLEMS